MCWTLAQTRPTNDQFILVRGGHRPHYRCLIAAQFPYVLNFMSKKYPSIWWVFISFIPNHDSGSRIFWRLSHVCWTGQVYRNFWVKIITLSRMSEYKNLNPDIIAPEKTKHCIWVCNYSQLHSCIFLAKSYNCGRKLVFRGYVKKLTNQSKN